MWCADWLFIPLLAYFVFHHLSLFNHSPFHDRLNFSPKLHGLWSYPPPTFLSTLPLLCWMSPLWSPQSDMDPLVLQTNYSTFTLLPSPKVFAKDFKFCTGFVLIVSQNCVILSIYLFLKLFPFLLCLIFSPHIIIKLHNLFIKKDLFPSNSQNYFNHSISLVINHNHLHSINILRSLSVTIWDQLKFS